MLIYSRVVLVILLLFSNVPPYISGTLPSIILDAASISKSREFLLEATGVIVRLVILIVVNTSIKELLMP